MYPFIVWKIMPLLDCINQISKCTMCTCCGKTTGLFSQRKRVVPIAIIRRKFSVSKLKSPSRLSTNHRNTTFWLLDVGTRVADVSHSFGRNEQTRYRLQIRFRQPGSKNDKPPSGRPRITKPLEVIVIVTSIWRNRFMAAWKLLKHLRHATDTRISV